MREEVRAESLPRRNASVWTLLSGSEDAEALRKATFPGVHVRLCPTTRVLFFLPFGHVIFEMSVPSLCSSTPTCFTI